MNKRKLDLEKLGLDNNNDRDAPEINKHLKILLQVYSVLRKIGYSYK